MKNVFITVMFGKKFAVHYFFDVIIDLIVIVAECFIPFNISQN